MDKKLARNILFLASSLICSAEVVNISVPCGQTSLTINISLCCPTNEPPIPPVVFSNFPYRSAIMSLTSGNMTYCPTGLGISPFEKQFLTTNMLLAYIATGRYTKGSCPQECGRSYSVEPETQVAVNITQSMYVGIFEITRGQWNFDATNYRSARGNLSWNMVRGGTISGQISPTSFIGRLRLLSGKNINLPTENVWEYFCRAGTTNSFNDNSGYMQTACTNDNIRNLGWYYLYSSNVVHSVGELAPNRWGLFDTHGNLSEFCDGLVGGYKIPRRGGGFYDQIDRLRSAAKSWDIQSQSHPTYGARIVVYE